jgi:hypothetical protein
MVQTTMMMGAIFQLTLILMPTTGNMEPIIPGTPPMEPTTLGITHTEWEMDLAPGSMDMDLNMTMMVAISLPILMLTPIIGSMEPTIPGILLTEQTTHGTIPTIWEMDQEAMTGLTPVTQLTPLT